MLALRFDVHDVPSLGHQHADRVEDANRMCAGLFLRCQPEQLGVLQSRHLPKHLDLQRMPADTKHELTGHQVSESLSKRGHFRTATQRASQRDGRREAALEVHVLAEKRKAMLNLAQSGFDPGISERPKVRRLAAHQNAGALARVERGKKGGQILRRELFSACVGHSMCALVG